jgi:microcystin-dependent protein
MDPYLGEILLVAFGYAPAGWSTCAGQVMQINQNQALFALIGSTYGGDGISTFRLPMLTAPTGMTYIIAIQGVFPTRD